MGPDEKDTGPLTVYMDGQPVGIAGGEIPEISLAEEKPGIYLEGETIDAIRKKAEEMYISEAVFNRELAEAITRAWNNLTDTMAAAAGSVHGVDQNRGGGNPSPKRIENSRSVGLRLQPPPGLPLPAHQEKADP